MTEIESPTLTESPVPGERQRSSAVSLMIADDSSDERAATKRALMGSELAITGESALGTEAVAMARELRPDIILVAVEEPVASALRTIEALNVVVPQSPVVALSTLNGRDHLRQAMVAGARDYLARPVDSEELEKAI